MLTSTDTASSAGPSSLTPPASPLDPNTADVVTGPINQPPTPKATSPGVVDKKKLTHSLVQEVWQEITVTKPAMKYVNVVCFANCEHTNKCMKKPNCLEADQLAIYKM